MQFNRTIALKDGTECLLRSPAAEDAEALLEHLRITSGETDFMIRYPDEITLTLDQERAYLERMANEPRAAMICAFVGGKLLASAGLNPVSPLSRLCHRAEFGLSVRREAWGLGIGGALIQAVFDVGRAAGYEQIELSVVSENARAIRLYERMGFAAHGRIPGAFRYRDGRYADEIIMTKGLRT